MPRRTICHMSKSRMITIALILLLGLSACTIQNGEESPEKFDQLMRAGKRALAAGDGPQAQKLFAQALKVEPSNSSASLGLVLADVLKLLQFADDIVTFVIDIGGTFTAAEEVPNPGGLVPSNTLDQTIHHFVKQIFEPLLDEMLSALDDALADPEISLNLQALPLSFGGSQFADLAGNWAAADVTWLAAVTRLLQGLVDILQGSNMNFDIGAVLESQTVHYLINGQPLDLYDTVDEVLELVLFILNDPNYPDFLLPLPDAEWRFERAQRNLALALYWGVGVWYMVETQPAPEASGILSYQDLNGNRKREANEPFIFNEAVFPAWLMTALPALRAIGWKAQAAMAEGTDLDSTPDVYETFDLASFNMLLNAAHLPALIPSTPVDFAAWFAAPTTAETKQTISDLLQFIHDLLYGPEPAG